MPADLTCQHHWLLEDPDCGETFGRCKFCGAERTWKTTYYGDNYRGSAILPFDPLPKYRFPAGLGGW